MLEKSSTKTLSNQESEFARLRRLQELLEEFIGEQAASGREGDAVLFLVD